MGRGGGGGSWTQDQVQVWAVLATLLNQQINTVHLSFFQSRSVGVNARGWKTCPTSHNIPPARPRRRLWQPAADPPSRSDLLIVSNQDVAPDLARTRAAVTSGTPTIIRSKTQLGRQNDPESSGAEGPRRRGRPPTWSEFGLGFRSGVFSSRHLSMRVPNTILTVFCMFSVHSQLH